MDTVICQSTSVGVFKTHMWKNEARKTIGNILLKPQTKPGFCYVNVS